MFTSKPKIRTRTVAVPVSKPVPSTADKTPSLERKSSQSYISNGARKPTTAPPASRYSLTPATKARASSSHQSQPVRHSLSVSRVQQRKRKVTPSTPQWASSDESSDGEDSDRLGSGLRKRQKTSNSIEPVPINRCLSPDPARRIRIPRNESKRDEAGANAREGGEKASELIHGLKMSRGEWAKDFKPAFSGKENIVVELQYPSSSAPEKFETVVPKDDTNFNPLDDIYFSVDEIIQHYLPSDIAADLSSETAGTVRLLKRAVTKNSTEDFTSALGHFNQLIREKLSDDTIGNVLDSIHAIPLSLTKRILAQVYQRTVSPYAHLLRRVKGKETTYGELLPPFVHTIFHQTKLSSTSVFIDLGSGVGNVVLQSALQTGAESWGIEIMDRPAEFASSQASELRARAKLWNISLGPMTLLQGDFLESEEVNEVLRRADVILVNNKVFPQHLNNNLLNKFLDLKHGCRVVSLESFGGGGKQGVRNEQSIANLFDEERYESGTNSVSWAGESVEYFIATKAR